jgi:flagellar assembly protein FliH
LYNQAEKFVRAYTFRDSFGTSRKEGPHEGTFEFDELAGKLRNEERRFSFDSEKARNFDEVGIARAREGVKEIVADAINKAKDKALEIKALARHEGYEAGYTDGFEKGEESAKAEFAPLLQSLQDTLAELGDLRKKMYSKVEREMVEMIVDLAKKVIRFELSTREDSVQDMIRIAVESVLQRERMTIRINPADKIHAESFRPELLQAFEEIKSITFEAHPSVEKGGCIIESNFGTVDARIEKLYEPIDKILDLAPPAPEIIES